MSKGSDDEIPKVWSDLMWAIGERESLRRTLPIVEPSAPPEPPYNFHGYEVTGWKLGGMGMVLLGRDPKLDRKVALKLLQSSGPEADAALITEAQTLAKLSHPNVVTVYGVSEWEGGVFFTMEHVDGMNGQEWLKRDPAWQETLDVFIDAGQGLAAAHDKGIQHGDFKPANMLIGTDGRTRVADFGIADYLCAEEGVDQPTGRRRPGTPEYMAPERLRGRRGDARSDQYSFCVALWGGLHGTRPYHGKTAFELLDAIEAGAIQPRVPDARVPRWLTAVIRKGLAEDPDERYRDMPELLRALKGGSDGDETATGEPDDDDDPLEHDGRVLHSPAIPAGVQRERWPYVAVGFLSALVLVLGYSLLTRSPMLAPASVAEAVEADPYDLILAAINDNDFGKAEELWDDHKKGGLTDAQSLEIATTCLSRAKEIERLDPAKAKDAAWTAYTIAMAVERFGTNADVRRAAGRAAADAWAEIDVDRPIGADVRGLNHAQSEHRARGVLMHPSSRLFHVVFSCRS